MKTAVLIGFALLSVGFSLQAQMLSAGDSIKLDFSSTTDNSGILHDWNLLQENTTISAGSVVLNGSANVAPGVSVSTNGSGSNMDPNTMNWPGFANDPYYNSNAEAGLIYSLNSGLGILDTPYEFDITFSGLTVGTTLNIRVYRIINESLANFDVGVTNGAGRNFSSNINRQDVFNETSLDPRLIFNGVQPDASRNLIVSIGSTDAIGAEALVLEVVPEPSTWALLLGGTGLLSVTLYRKRGLASNGG